MAMRALLDRVRALGFRAGAHAPERSVPVALPGGDPAALKLLLERAAERLAAGDEAGARAAASEALTLEAGCARAHLLLGRVARRLGEMEEAADCLRLALHFDPALIDACLELASLLKAGSDQAGALACYAEGIASAPASASLHAHYAVALLQAGRAQEAEGSCATAIELDPQLPAAWHNRGYIRLQRGELAGALADFERAAALQSRPAESLGCMAHAQRDMGRPVAAIACDHRALGFDPVLADAQKNLAFAELMLGDLAQGWPRYEWRFGAEGPPLRLPGVPRWEGQDLSGKRLLVYREQGISDEILFASMYPDLRALGGECVLECHPKLAPLFGRSFPWAAVVEFKRQAPALGGRQADYQISAGSLARLLRPCVDRFPQDRGFLRGNLERTQRWRERFDALGAGPKVGFSWRSGNRSLNRGLESTSLEDWGALFAVPGIRWICLQYDECSEELASARETFAVRLERFEEVDWFDDLDEVGNVMSALDLVISTRTAVSVQAAALGVPTWQLTYGVDWQTHGTERNVWLPALRRFERRWDESWQTVIARAARALREQAPARRREVSAVFPAAPE
jgi:tetratricopeptide (TPR) repeat protein